VIDVKLWVIQDDINLFVQLQLQVVEIVLDAKFIVHRYVKLLTKIQQYYVQTIFLFTYG
jgi:hypothetical protein